LLEEKVCILPHPSELDRVIAFTLVALIPDATGYTEIEAVSDMRFDVRR
jgi:hypothetical protein